MPKDPCKKPTDHQHYGLPYALEFEYGIPVEGESRELFLRDTYACYPITRLYFCTVNPWLNWTKDFGRN